MKEYQNFCHIGGVVQASVGTLRFAHYACRVGRD